MSPPSPLARLLRPRSIAVVGGGVWCEAVIAQCRRMGFAGTLYAVHPRRDTLGDVAAVARVEDLPEAPDAAFVGVNADATIGVVAALAARGAGGAICFARGFAETGEIEGRRRQHALLEAADSLALLGPNCYGFVNALDGAALWPDQHGLAPAERGVAIVTQSSNLALNLSMQRRGLPIGFLVASGNQAGLGFAALGTALLEDARVSALGLHVEGVGEASALDALAARASGLGKPVIALKVGRSNAARRAARSHSAALAGSDAGSDALLARLGIARAETLADFLETLKLLHAHHPLEGDGAGALRLASLSCSGGEASLVADAAWRADARAGTTRRAHPRIVFPAPDAARRRALADALGPRVALANPLDYDTGIWRDADALERVFRAMTGPDIDLTLLVLDWPREDRCDAHEWRALVAVLERVARETKARFALLASLPDNLPEALARRLLAAGIAPLAGFDEALLAARDAAWLARRAFAARAAPPLPPGRARDTALWSEHAAKRALAAHGVAVPEGGSADSPEAAVALAARLGFPVALKGAGLAHKSDAGAVALALADAEAVARAARAMPAERFLVERMVGDGVAELLVGVVRDAAHGFVLTLGAGGVLAEILDDRVSLLLPVDADEIDAALAALRLAPVLDGARGRPSADRAAIVDAVLAVQGFVIDNADAIEELEINPLLCRPDAAIALDALLVAAPAEDPCVHPDEETFRR